MHHDDALGRLTEGSGRLDAMTRRRAQARPVQGHRRPHADARRIVRSGRRPRAAADRAQEPLRRRLPAGRRAPPRCWPATAGRSALMSFDPGQIAALRADRARPDARHRRRTPLRRIANGTACRLRRSARMAFLLHAPRTRPQFVAYRGRGPAGAGAAGRAHCSALPLLTWTVRSDGRPRARRALGRPDDLRGLSAVNAARRAKSR